MLAAGDLKPNLLRALLNRLVRPDLRNLPDLIVRDLKAERSRGFGPMNIHRNLLLEQLEDCARLHPELLNTTAFIETVLVRLRPNADLSLLDPATREAYLNRLQAFVARLSMSQNSLKAHVLHHRIKHDLAAGKLDKQRFLAYLRFPRHATWANPERLKRRRSEAAIVDTSVDFATGLGAIGNEDLLVRRCFETFFAREASFEAYRELVESDYLRRLFAETKILSGDGEKERWYSMLDDPGYTSKVIPFRGGHSHPRNRSRPTRAPLPVHSSTPARPRPPLPHRRWPSPMETPLPLARRHPGLSLDSTRFHRAPRSDPAPSPRTSTHLPRRLRPRGFPTPPHRAAALGD
jgi:hypothetical protein